MGARGRKSQAELMVVARPESPRRLTSGPASVPKDLGPAGKKLWEDITAEFSLETSAEAQQFYEACCMEDRAA